jgi:hypothetical protein
MVRARSWIIGIVLLEAVGLAAACSSFSADDAPGAADGGNETSDKDTFVGPGIDGSADADAGLDPTLVFAEDFEKSTLDSCGDRWVPQSATAVGTAPGRDGGKACRICTLVSPGNFYGVRISGLPAVAGQAYVGQAWMKQGDTAVSAAGAFAQLDYSLADGGNGTSGLPNPLVAEWTRYTITATPQGPTPSVAFFAGTNATKSAECFLLDDVTLRTQ